MKKRIENIDDFLTALDEGAGFYDGDGDERYIGREWRIGEVENLIKTQGLYAVKPAPEPPLYVYRKLHWEKKYYPIVTVQELQGGPVLRLAHVGTGHWENGREYRLCGFTSIASDDILNAFFPYTECPGKMTYARFELQSKETD